MTGRGSDPVFNAKNQGQSSLTKFQTPPPNRGFFHWIQCRARAWFHHSQIHRSPCNCLVFSLIFRRNRSSRVGSVRFLCETYECVAAAACSQVSYHRDKCCQGSNNLGEKRKRFLLNTKVQVMILAQLQGTREVCGVCTRHVGCYVFHALQTGRCAVTRLLRKAIAGLRDVSVCLSM